MARLLVQPRRYSQWCLVHIMLIVWIAFLCRCAEIPPTFEHRLLFNPLFEAAGYEPSDRNTLLLSQNENSNYVYLYGRGSTELLYWPGKNYGSRFSQMIGSRPLSHEDEIRKVRDMVKDHTSFTASKDKCHGRLFESSDLLPAGPPGSPGYRFAFGLADTYLCLIMYSNDTSGPYQANPVGSRKIDLCRFLTYQRPLNATNEYHLTALTVELLPFTMGSPLVAQIKFFDEAGHMYSVNLNLDVEMDGIMHLRCIETLSRSLGAIDMDAQNRIAMTRLFIDPKDEFDEKQLTRSQFFALKQIDHHFQMSFIESITFFQGALYYSRGRKIWTDKLVRSINDNATNVLPPNLYVDNQLNLSIQAMEIYEFEGRRKMHFAGILFDEYQSLLNDPRDKSPYKDPIYYYCDVASDYRFTESIKVPEEHLPECRFEYLDNGLMPIDFVLYQTDRCHKLVVFYQHMLRMFEPNENLKDHGQDYDNRPFQVYDWMTESLRAVMFHQGRFYMFLTGNRLWIEKNQRAGSCAYLLTGNGEFAEALGSELIFQFENVAYGQKRATTAYYDGLRWGKRSADGKQWEFYPPLEDTKVFPPEFLVSPKDEPVIYDPKNRTNTTPQPTEKPASEDKKFPTIIVVCIVVIVVAVICGIIYYFYFSGSNERQLGRDSVFGAEGRKSRKVLSPQQQTGGPLGSALSGHMTARSALSQSDALTSGKPIQNPQVPSQQREQTPSKSPRSPMGSVNLSPSKSKVSKSSPNIRSPHSKSSKTKSKASNVTSPQTKSLLSGKSLNSTSPISPGASKSPNSPTSPKSPKSPAALNRVKSTKSSKSTKSKSPGAAPLRRTKSTKTVSPRA